jgi:opacity protein-like surface antigen
MRKWTVLALLGLMAAAAYGIGMGVGGFYALSLPMGDLADSYKMNVIGFGGKVMVGVMPYLNVDVGFGYHMKYENNADLAAEYDPDNWYLTTIPITFGVSYPLTFDSMGVYFGGGGAFVMEKAYFEIADPAGGGVTTGDESVNKPGFYVGGGFKYGFTDKLALDINPRWMMVMDAKDDDPDTVVDESTTNSMFVDILIGVDYFFM